MCIAVVSISYFEQSIVCTTFIYNLNYRCLYLVIDAVKNQTKVKNVDQNEKEERLKYHLA